MKPLRSIDRRRLASAARVGAAVVVLLAATAARGDGAFPNAMALLLPEDRPDEITLATNFGLVLTRDGGATWRWVCEQAVDPSMVFLYQAGPPPADRLFAVGSGGIHRSDDACAWTTATFSAGGGDGGATSASPTDVFASPTDPSRVLAIATLAGLGGGAPSALCASGDGGGDFDEVLTTAPAGSFLASVEIPRTRPQWIYATAATSTDLRPQLLRSQDGGRSFASTDLFPALGAATVAIASVDPTDEARLFLRVFGPATDSLAIVDGGGTTVRVALPLAARMTAFLRRQDGTLLVAGADGLAYRSHDGGGSFSPWPVAVPLRALAERGGRLYAAASGVTASFAVAVSDDGGDSFQPLFAFTDLCGPLACAEVTAACASRWAALAAQLGVQGAAACGGPAKDAGSNPGGSASAGCGCALGALHAPRSDGSPAVLLVAVALLALVRSLSASVRRRRPSQSRP